MSIRCTISVFDISGRYSIYRHVDGDPSSVLGDLRDVFARAWPLPRFDASDFSAAIVATWKKAGGNIRLSAGKNESADTDYHYEITPNGDVFSTTAIIVKVFSRADDGTWTTGTSHRLSSKDSTKASRIRES